jgi:hypothetical protein
MSCSIVGEVKKLFAQGLDMVDYQSAMKKPSRCSSPGKERRSVKRVCRISRPDILQRLFVSFNMQNRSITKWGFCRE